MQEYELQASQDVQVRIESDDLGVEVSFSGRAKWSVVDAFSEHVYRVGFINFGTYLIKNLPSKEGLILKVESFEEIDVLLYITRL